METEARKRLGSKSNFRWKCIYSVVTFTTKSSRQVTRQ